MSHVSDEGNQKGPGPGIIMLNIDSHKMLSCLKMHYIDMSECRMRGGGATLLCFASEWSQPVAAGPLLPLCRLHAFREGLPGLRKTSAHAFLSALWPHLASSLAFVSSSLREKLSCWLWRVGLMHVQDSARCSSELGTGSVGSTRLADRQRVRADVLWKRLRDRTRRKETMLLSSRGILVTRSLAVTIGEPQQDHPSQ